MAKFSSRFDDMITDEAALQSVLGQPSAAAANKAIDHIDHYCRQFIERSPFAIIASTGATGVMDLSPKGDPDGFVHVLDDRTLAIPDRLGNKRADTFRNILRNPTIGLIFLVPGRRETLRISGSAAITRDTALREQLAHKDRLPELVLVVDVACAMYHCSKCMIRSGLWEPDKWSDVSDMPSLAEIIRVHAEWDAPLADVETHIAHSAEHRLY